MRRRPIVVLSEGTREPSLFLRTSANELWGQFSPDGRWVAYQSNETGQYEIYVRPFAGQGQPVPVSTAGGVYPRWSRDGKELLLHCPRREDDGRSDSSHGDGD